MEDSWIETDGGRALGLKGRASHIVHLGLELKHGQQTKGCSHSLRVPVDKSGLVISMMLSMLETYCGTQ